MPRRQQTRSGRSIAVGWPEASSGDGSHGDERSAPHAPGAAGRSGPDGPLSSQAPAGNHGRRPLLLVGAVAAILALVLVLPPVLLGGVPAEEVAERYLEAVVAGDAETVREHLAPQEDVLDIALTDQVLAATRDPIERFSIDEVRIDGDRAEIIATLTLGDNALETTLHLARHREGMLRRQVWELRPVQLPVVSVEIPVGSDALRVNGTLLEIPAAQQPREAFGMSAIRLHVLPGTIELRAQEIGDHVIPREVGVDVPPVLGDWTGRSAGAGYELTDQGTQELSAQLVDSLEECAGSSSPRPPGCPLAAPPEASGPGSWELVGVPDIRVAEQDRGLIVLMVIAAAEFTVAPGGSDTASDSAARTAAPQTHRVEVEARAAALLDRDGRFSADWLLGPTDGDGAPAQ